MPEPTPPLQGPGLTREEAEALEHVARAAEDQAMGSGYPEHEEWNARAALLRQLSQRAPTSPGEGLEAAAQKLARELEPLEHWPDEPGWGEATREEQETALACLRNARRYVQIVAPFLAPTSPGEAGEGRDLMAELHEEQCAHGGSLLRIDGLAVDLEFEAATLEEQREEEAKSASGTTGGFVLRARAETLAATAERIRDLAAELPAASTQPTSAPPVEEAPWPHETPPGRCVHSPKTCAEVAAQSPTAFKPCAHCWPAGWGR